MKVKTSTVDVYGGTDGRKDNLQVDRPLSYGSWWLWIAACR